MSTLARALLAVSFLAAPLAAAAADALDCENCKDNPGVARFPGFYLEEATYNDFNRYEFPDTADTVVAQEGRYWELHYQLKDGARAPSAFELAKNYEAAFKKQGGKMVTNFMENGGGQASFKMPLGKSERWLSVQSTNDNHTMSLTIVEVAKMEQKVEVDANAMLDALTRDGFIALHGITFDTGKDVIKPESEPLLAEIVALLNGNAGLKLSVEGHTDNAGDKKANLALSKKRAEAVKKYLVSKGVATARLTTDGFGDGKPVADNRSEDGRAQNRRVELVKK